jgi:hypothetical protein
MSPNRRMQATGWASQRSARSKIGISIMGGDRHDLESDLEKVIADYIELQREVVENMTGSESIAQSINDAVDEAIPTIRSPVDSSIADAVARFRSLPEEYIEPALELFTARAFRVLLPDMVLLENRIETLVKLAHDAAPSQRAAATLAKIVRCYLVGFDAETIAMCRAALDVSVSDAVESLPTDSRRTKPASMRKKLDLLRETGRLSGLDTITALEVWEQGNEVLHNNSDEVRNAPEVVSKGLRVIGALFPPTVSIPQRRIE